jgi:hypothetical protein
MKKTIAISFLFLFLCANTEIGQLLKVPALINHYIEHREYKNEHTVSFIAFVESHYNHKQHSDTDKHEEHKNLPFKTVNSLVNILFAFNNQTEFLFLKPTIISTNISTPFSKDFYTSDVFACIWLPPKLS